jgi:hypothetical protein
MPAAQQAARRKTMKRFALSLALAGALLATTSRARADHRLDVWDLSEDDQWALVDLLWSCLTDDFVQVHTGFVHDVHEGHHFFEMHRDYVAAMEACVAELGGEALLPLPVWDPATPIPEAFQLVRPFDDGRERRPIANPEPNRPIPASLLDPAICAIPDLHDLGHATIPWHNGVHGAVGGAMGFISTSPAALVFWPWHAYVDTVYERWEACPR